MPRRLVSYYASWNTAVYLCGFLYIVSTMPADLCEGFEAQSLRAKIAGACHHKVGIVTRAAVWATRWLLVISILRESVRVG